ncbi:hypothetical protein H1C71_023094, partial [Ictidomys tridecemlineatus]
MFVPLLALLQPHDIFMCVHSQTQQPTMCVHSQPTSLDRPRCSQGPSSEDTQLGFNPAPPPFLSYDLGQVTVSLRLAQYPSAAAVWLDTIPGVYIQIAVDAVRAWKTLQGHGSLQGQLSKVIQGANEPYAEFVDRLIQTA